MPRGEDISQRPTDLEVYAQDMLYVQQPDYVCIEPRHG